MARPEIALPPGVAVTVGRHSVSTGSLERWTEVEAALLADYSAGGSRVPWVVITHPPDYRECIAFLVKVRAESEIGPTLGAAQLKPKCEKSHRIQQEAALNQLMVGYWVHDEAARQGLRVDNADVRAEAKRLGIRLNRPQSAGGVPFAYVRFSVGTEILLRKLDERLPIYSKLKRDGSETLQMAAEIDNAVGRFNAEMTRRVTAGTHCRPEFVVPLCSEYRHT